MMLLCFVRRLSLPRACGGGRSSSEESLAANGSGSSDLLRIAQDAG